MPPAKPTVQPTVQLTRQEAHNRARAAMMDEWRATGSSRIACSEYDRVMRECGYEPTGPECDEEDNG